MTDHTIKNLTHIKFSDDFNKPFDENYIPDNTTHLTFG